MFCVACARPWMRPTAAPLACSVCVRNTGSTGYSISVEMSANRLAQANHTVFFDTPEK